MAPLVHLALAQFKPRKGDYRGNLERLRPVFAQIDQLSPRPMVLALAESALTGYFLEGGVRDNAVTAGTLARDLDVVVPRRRSRRRRPLDVVDRVLRDLEQQAVQQLDVRDARRRRAADPTRASKGLPADVRPVRRGAFRRARPRGPRVRHAVGPRRDARLRGRLAQHDRHDRRARRRADHLRLRGAAGARAVAEGR